MSQFYGDPQLDPPASSNSSMVAIHADRQGNLITKHGDLADSVAGKQFVANMGTRSAPITVLGATIVVRRPQAFIRVPLGTTIVPKRVKFTCLTSGASVSEFSVAQCSNDVGNGTSAAATVGPVNMNTRLGADSGQCTPRQLASADVDVEVNPVEYDFQTFASDADDYSWEYLPTRNGEFPVLTGPATWAVYAGGTTVLGWFVFTWTEVASGFLVP